MLKIKDSVNLKKLEKFGFEKGLYLCTPLLNKECTKENCYINNGCCCHTVNEEYSQEHLLNYITNLQEENQKLNKIIDELEKWLKETKKFNYGFKIKSEYIYTYEFVCKNILNKLTELKKRWNK